VNIQPFFATLDFVQSKHRLYCFRERGGRSEEKIILLTCLVKPSTIKVFDSASCLRRRTLGDLFVVILRSCCL